MGLFPMIVDLRTILLGSQSYQFDLGVDWWGSDERNDHILAFDDPLTIKLKISDAGNKYALNGYLSGGLQVRCDRCLAPYHEELRTVFELFLSLSLEKTDTPDIELMEEDMEVNFIGGEEINLDEIIREQVYLALPMKSLCKENCLGLCPICGSNLNEGNCPCLKEQGHPGFLKLKNLEIKGE